MSEITDETALARLENTARWLSAPGEHLGDPRVWAETLIELAEYLRGRLENHVQINRDVQSCEIGNNYGTINIYQNQHGGDHE